MCSPYLTGSLAVMLVIVAFNYWSVATENSELSKKLQEMQQQLKRGSEHIERLDVFSKYFCANVIEIFQSERGAAPGAGRGEEVEKL